MAELSSINIPFEEMRAINQMVQGHGATHKGKLKALIAFGDLVITGEARDIQLLEIVEGWQGPRCVEFGSTNEIPLRGTATLYFLLPEEFEQPSDQVLPGAYFSSRSLIRQVQQGYAVLANNPPGYGQSVLRRHPELADVTPAMFFSRNDLLREEQPLP